MQVTSHYETGRAKQPVGPLLQEENACRLDQVTVALQCATNVLTDVVNQMQWPRQTQQHE